MALPYSLVLTTVGLLASFNGITEEHRIGRSFEEALPFTSPAGGIFYYRVG